MLSENDSESKDCSVRVATRIRPQNSRELIDMCRICTTVTEGEPQIILGSDKAFTFDYVYDIHSSQCDIYTECVEHLVNGALRGYNATVLAYGQTGSGKTYTMGTGFDHTFSDNQLGIIPRAVRHLFAGIDDMHTSADVEPMPALTNAQFSVAVQFIELYNEDIIDLLDPYNKGRNFKIHESGNGQITVSGATIKPIHEPQEALKYLQQGALARTTASTKMNDQSSRSHALFTILIRRQRVLASENNFTDNDLETLTSKFHFVDLAGSERLKRTMATGERAREGISINCGLLALGNCISALGDKSKKATHIPYRDSKLTRLLQDSLGGNSQTLMIACVSPSDRDFMETLNTLKYANRARNIKNKVQINQDQSSRAISQLRRELAALQLELLEYKQGKRLVDCEGNTSMSDTFHENAMLLADNKRLQQRLKSLQVTIQILTERNAKLKVEQEMHKWPVNENSDSTITDIVANYLSEIEKLQAKLIESEEMYQQLKKTSTGNSPRASKPTYNDPDDIISLAKRGLEKDRELLMSRSLPGVPDENIEVEDADYSDSGSDSEGEEKNNKMEADLNDINSDIEIKTKLIEQLELSQQRMQIMRKHYEEKLTILNCKISNTQKERDEVLANMVSTNTGQSKDNTKKVKGEYEQKISDMQRELKRLQQAQREHIRQQKELKAQAIKLQNLRMELNELKCSKVKLMKKISEQTNKHKEEDSRKTREIAQLRKEQRRQQNTVLTLQAKVNAKEQILRRKNEEVSALRRSQRGSLTQKAAGRVPFRGDKKLHTRAAHTRWENLTRTISHAARNKQLITQLEKELERLMNERDALSHDLNNVQRRRDIVKGNEDPNEEDNIRTNISYLQENIEHVQKAIMEFEESKDSGSSQKIQSLLDNVSSIDEAKYLLQRLTDNAVLMSCNTAITEGQLQENDALLKDAQQENSVQQQLLQHFLSQNNNAKISEMLDSLNIGDNCYLPGLSRSCSQKSLISNGTYDIPFEEATMEQPALSDVQGNKSRSSSPAPTIDTSYEKSPKVRRRTARRQDLLFGDQENHKESGPMTRSYTQHEPMNRSFIPLMRVPSAPGSFKLSVQSNNVPSKSVVTTNKNSIQSPRLARRNLSNKTPTGFIDNVNDVPRSPPTYQRLTSREEPGSSTDVFSRLGAGTQDPLPGGSIQKYTGKLRLSDPLFCTNIVSGHNNSVLSIKVHDDMLYTAAADRTVKVWNLTRETAQHCLATHTGPVIAVQNDTTSGLLFSASGPFVRVWDLRVSNSKAIKTISSSGLLLSGNTNITGTAPGETPVTAMCLSASGNLYVAASDKVRVWDLKTLSCIGKLNCGHQAAVMCMSSWQGDLNGKADFVATGSKDHYVKVFEVPRNGGVVHPLINLEPPHYDGVQALVVPQRAVGTNVELFSGSRDSGIKQWDLKSGKLKQSLNNAHRGWVSAMAISKDILLSGCRGGVIRLWNINNCESIAQMKTDLMITDITVNRQKIFTASSDGKVRVWRWNNHLRQQYSIDSS